MQLLLSPRTSVGVRLTCTHCALYMRVITLCPDSVRPHMASVCTTFCTAAHMLLRRWPGLDLEHPDIVLPARLDSQLLLELAPTCFQRLWLGHDSLEVPGMFALVPACEQLVELEVQCLDMLACQRVNACLGGLSRLAILRCSGWLVPTSLRHCLHELVVDLSRWSAASLCLQGLEGAAEALLFTLADAPELKFLMLKLGCCPNCQQRLAWYCSSLRRSALTSDLIPTHQQTWAGCKHKRFRRSA